MSKCEPDLNYLLGLCQGDGFTLPEIVAKVVNENPDKIQECARAWNELNRRGLVKVKRRGRPDIYELVRQWV